MKTACRDQIKKQLEEVVSPYFSPLLKSLELPLLRAKHSSAFKIVSKQKKRSFYKGGHFTGFTVKKKADQICCCCVISMEGKIYLCKLLYLYFLLSV